MRLPTLNPIFYFLHGKLDAVVLDSPNGDDARIGIGMNYPESVSYSSITESPYDRAATPHWVKAGPPPKGDVQMTNYVGAGDGESLTVQPVVDATNHGHGKFTITNGEVTIVV